MFRFDTERQVSFYNHEMIWDTLIPSDSVYRLMRDFAPLLIKKEDFAGLYCENNGRSSIEALKMTMACMIQQMLDETDRGMEWLTQVNLEIKYALAMSLDEKGIDHANFHNHRQRLMEKKLDVLYLDRFTRLMYYLGILTGKEPFLTDTTHAVAPISVPSTIELIRQAMYLILRHISKKFTSDWEQLSYWPLAGRYLCDFQETKEHRLDDKQKNQRLLDVVREADGLLTFLEEQKSFWQKDSVTITRALILSRILHERITRNPDGTVNAAPNRNIRDIIVSAVDTEARFGNKGKTKWRGYKVATVEVGDSGFIAAAETLKANEYDGDSMEQLAEQLPVDLVENAKIIGDTHYGSAEHRKAMEDKGITVSAPLSDTVKIAKLLEEGFSVDSEHDKLICPKGRIFTKYNEVDNGRNFYLGIKDCKTCSRYSECFKGKKKRIVFIHNLFEVIEKAEKYNRTEDYRNDMRLRSRIEPKQNELANTYGLRRVRYTGERKLAFAARMKALAINFQKLKRLLTIGKYSKSHLSERLSEYGQVA